MIYGGPARNAQDLTPVSQDDRRPSPAASEPPARVLSPAAERALAEAAERRRLREAEGEARQKEFGGRAGPDPVRYGDWENGGIASDF